MVRTSLEAFQQTICETGAYATADDHRAAVPAKPGAWATFRYTLGATRVFLLSGLYQGLGLLTVRRWAGLCFGVVRAAEALGMRVLVSGFENRTRVSGPVVYLCNHLSMTETVLLPAILTGHAPLNYVAKASLAHLPFLETAAERMGMVPVGRTNPRADLVSVLTVGTGRLHAGNDFLIFPQGTRSEVFSRQRYSSIGAKLAERAGVPIVPIVVDTRCQPTRRTGLLKKVFKDFGPVDTARDIRVCFGPAIPAAKSREMHAAAFDWMAGQLEAWGMSVER